MPSHWIYSATVKMQGWTQVSNIQLTPVEVHGETLGNRTTHGIFGLKAKYTQAKELFTLEVWRTLWKLGRFYTVQEHSNRKVLGTYICSLPLSSVRFPF